MTVYRSIRIQLPDRPGSLSAITASLAAHGVDIVRLDVVSQEGQSAVDDLYLGAPSEDALDRAIRGFHSDVTAQPFSELLGDP
ncbi:MAG: ACT domain-containing protein, partial [Tepidiformaceae bacterium]